MDDLDRALADLDAAKTGQRRAREEVADLQLLLLQSRAENKSLQRSLERSQGELRELNSALSHFEESHREELELGGNLDTATTKRKLTRAKLERALAEEQEAHRATRRQLELCKLAAAEAEQTKTTGGREGKRSLFGNKSNRRRGGGGAKALAGGPFEGYDQHSDDEIPLSLEERKEEMERSSSEYRNVILMLTEEVENLKNQLSTVTQAFEDHIPLSQLIPLATKGPCGTEDGGTIGPGGVRGANVGSSPGASQPRDADKVRIIAARTIANLAAREERRPDIVGSLAQLLGVLQPNAGDNEKNGNGGGVCNSQLQRLVCAAVANLSIDSKYQGEVVRLGGLEALSHLSRTGRDSQTLRMCAGALANLCANALLKEELTRKGIVETLVGLLKRVSHPDVSAQVARGLANWVVGTDDLGIGRVLDEFATSGGLTTLLKLGGNREADLTVKKQVGTAIYHTLKAFPGMVKKQIDESENGIQPLLEMKKCAEKEVSLLAESCLNIYNSEMEGVVEAAAP